MSLLRANHLAKAFKSRQVVKDVSLSIQQGEIVGLLGPNGAGKTTSFYMILGLNACDTGEIFLDDEDLTYLPMDARARLGISYLPQEPSIFRKLTVADNILAILQVRQDLNAEAQEAVLARLLQDFHISHIKDSFGVSLSGGERWKLLAH